MPLFRMVVIAEEGVRLHDLDGDRWVIGREEGCELRLLDPSVSRKHAVLRFAGGVFRLEDLGARNPVLVDGKPVTEVEIVPGTEFMLGGTRLRIEAKDCSEIVISPERRSGNGRSTVHVLGEAPTIGTGVKLTTLDEIADALASADTSEELAEHTLDLLFRALPLKRGFVGRIDQAGRIKRLAIRNRSERDEDVGISKAVLQRLLTEARPILISEEAHGASGNGRVHTLMAAPLKCASRVAGILYGDHPSRTRSFTPGDLHLIAVIGRLLASRLETLELVERLRRENGEIRRWIGGEEPFVARSRAMQPVAEAIRKLGPHGIGVFIVGEPGSGKEALARELHRKGADPRAPFVAVHCSALKPAQAERELFGRTKGVQRHGKVVAAHGGILYLHEPERLPLELQARLAHLLEGVGLEAPGRWPVKISVRVVAGSCLHPEELGRKGLLARQLLDLLSGSVIELPPLRTRPDDIPLLVQGILKRLAAARAKQPAEMSARALQKLLLHHWPGNIRELARVVEGALVMSDGVTIVPRDLPPELGQGGSEKTPLHAFRTLEELQKDHILAVLDAVGGSRLQAASILGIAPSTIYDKLRRLQGDA